MRTKLLIGLCATFFVIATVEAVFLIRAHLEQDRIARAEARNPFRAIQPPDAPDPWSSLHDKVFRDFEDDPFFKDFGRGIFDKLRRRHLPPGFGRSFGQESVDTFSFETPKWEDKGNEVRMVMNIKGHEQGDYSVNVSGEQVTLTGKDKVSTNDQGVTAESHWSNTQSFPLPPEVDPKSFHVERTKDQFIVIFKKRGNGSSSSS